MHRYRVFQSQMQLLVIIRRIPDKVDRYDSFPLYQTLGILTTTTALVKVISGGYTLLACYIITAKYTSG